MKTEAEIRSALRQFAEAATGAVLEKDTDSIAANALLGVIDALCFVLDEENTLDKILEDFRAIEDTVRSACAGESN